MLKRLSWARSSKKRYDLWKTSIQMCCLWTYFCRRR